MISRRILAAVALLCTLCAPAWAQKTKATIDAEINTLFPDNIQYQITPFDLRSVTSDIVNSIMPTAPVVAGNSACFSGTTGLLQDCGSSPSLYLPLAGGTMSGNIVMGGNNITGAAAIIGGSATTGNVFNIQSTSGAGTTEAIRFLGGNNGATTMMTILDGTVPSVGINTVPSATLHVNAPSGNATVEIQNTTGNVQMVFGSATAFITSTGALALTAGSSSDVVVAPGGTEHARFNSIGHATYTGTIPTFASGTPCGTSPTIATGSTDIGGEVTTGGSATTSCQVTFANAYTNAPFCIATPVGAANSGLFLNTPATATMTFNYTSATSLKINYHCFTNGAG